MNEEFLPKDLDGKLARVTEECGEVLQIIGKIGRFGYYSTNPLLPRADRKENWVLLESELEDLQHAIEAYLVEAGRVLDYPVDL